jgi:hypothetical protein
MVAGCRAETRVGTAESERRGDSSAWQREASLATVPIESVEVNLNRCRLEAASGTATRSFSPGASSRSLCRGVIYVWWEGMPLSAEGIPEIRAAAQQLGIDVHVVNAISLYPDETDSSARDRTDARAGERRNGEGTAHLLRQAGATVHAPAAVPFVDGELTAATILGYKTAEGYRRLIKASLAEAARSPHPNRTSRIGVQGRRLTGEVGDGAGRIVRDVPIKGEPGPYFRRVGNLPLVSIVVANRAYLVDMVSSHAYTTPAWVDLVPTPDKALFVTPSRDRKGLQFYDGDSLIAMSMMGTAMGLRPVYVDESMRDEYPSVGMPSTVLHSRIAENRSASTTYRVVTGWYDGAIAREYIAERKGGLLQVRPAGGAKVICHGRALSLPILAPDGRTFAAHDQRRGSTVILWIESDGTCRELLDTGLRTGKVAFDPSSRLAAFAIPPDATRPATSREQAGLRGVFVADLEAGVVTRIVGSEKVNRLTFPEFIGSDSLMFLLSRPNSYAPTVLRLTCCFGR